MALALRQRMETWLLARRAPSDQVTLTQRQVYILPTRAGLLLAATLLVLLVASINYQLNLGYLLTFLIAGCAVAGMHVGHGTLRGLQMHLLPPVPGHAGTAAVLRVVLHNTGRRTRFGIGLAVRGSGHWSWTDVPAQGETPVDIGFLPPRRGLHAVPMLTAETRFPMGAFRVWTVWRPAAQLLVWPAAEVGAPPLPTGPADADNTSPARRQAGGSGFEGVRVYQRGDPLRQLVWKRVARAQAAGSEELVSRDSQQSSRHSLWLDAAATGLPDAEARLSRLTAWVLQADRLELDYGLRIGGRSLGPSRGEAHRRACLEALALAP
ncbi:MAG: DUF58 domain-containing protein [Pseudacidovorax sp.]|uniref:DUF58 domain-containing protein n=1 Tax=Pseudacidovorax sp. TaxID=1934311 RepID=UPI001B6D1A85|nr:DUF58 domain-containing protein [Pseudacidovorax sp.]MBP6895086.1 DUF58 domain-containing protein [Pseudacidovorax sp.]